MPLRLSAAKVSGKYRPARSTLGSIRPSTACVPHMPGGRVKRQTGASRKAGSQASPISDWLPAITDCSQSSQGSVKSRGRPARTKSPRAGSLP